MIERPRIVVRLDGGLVSSVHSDTDVKVLVMDYDDEGEPDGDKVVRVNTPGFEGNVCHTHHDVVAEDKKLIDQLFNG